MINRFLKDRAKTLTAIIFVGGVILSLAGCDSPDLGHQATQQELDQAKQQAANSAASRTDLTPEQKAGLKNYYGGGAPSGPGPGRGGPGAPPTATK